MDEAPERARRLGVRVTFYRSGGELRNAFPFSFPRDAEGILEPSPSGHIDPRRLIQAQLSTLEMNDGVIVRDVVNHVQQIPHGVVLTTFTDQTLRANKVVVAAGSFTNFADLLPRRLALTLKSETVILARLRPEEVNHLKHLPSLLYEIDVPEMEGIYSTPPLVYPDGQVYLKMGCNLPEDIFFGDDLEGIRTWFREGDSDAHIEKMREALLRILPGLPIDECVSRRCILTRTAAHENPYIGRVDERIYVAVGNGWSAMCSDGIGSVAAHLVREGGFPHGLDPSAFAPVFGD